MPIQRISREQLDWFLPHRLAIGRFIGLETGWFADGPGNIIGTIAESATNTNWGYVVLRRDVNGAYLLWDLKTKIGSCDAARTQMVRVMEATQSGQNYSSAVG